MKKIFKYILIYCNIISPKTISRMRKHLVRVVSDEEILKFLHLINYKNLNTLEISGERWKGLFNAKNYKSLSFPTFDIEGENGNSNQYDLIILEHILEHVSNPKLALRNLFNLLKSGGWIILVTPFLIKVHKSPLDCTRWTKEGLNHLLQQVGFEKKDIIVGQWGNKSAVKANFHRWVKYNPFKHSLKNEEEFPVAVWAFAQKT